MTKTYRWASVICGRPRPTYLSSLVEAITGRYTHLVRRTSIRRTIREDWPMVTRWTLIHLRCRAVRLFRWTIQPTGSFTRSSGNIRLIRASAAFIGMVGYGCCVGKGTSRPRRQRECGKRPTMIAIRTWRPICGGRESKAGTVRANRTVQSLRWLFHRTRG